MASLEANLQNTEGETALKAKINTLDNEILELDIERRRFKENEKKFGDLKKRLLKEIAQAEAEAEKNAKDMQDLEKEGIPQA